MRGDVNEDGEEDTLPYLGDVVLPALNVGKVLAALFYVGFEAGLRGVEGRGQLELMS